METQTWKSIAAGILTIVAGVFGLRGLSRLVIISRVHPRTPGIAPHMFNFIGAFHLPIAIILGLLGALAIVGGIYALKRKIWGLALAGSIAAIFGSMPLGIAGLVLTVLSKKEFE
jgi:hypothetical protein